MLLTVPASAQAPETWTEESEWQIIGETWLLSTDVRKRVYNDPSVQQQFGRVGIANACPIAHAVTEAVVDEAAEDFRNAALSGLRERYSPDESYENRFAIMPNGGLSGWLLGRLKANNEALFTVVGDEATARLVRELSSMASTEGNWRGRFDDWDFSSGSGLIYSAACLVELNGDPDNNKRVFDGFYQTRGRQSD